MNFVSDYILRMSKGEAVEERFEARLVIHCEILPGLVVPTERLITEKNKET